MYKFKLGYLVSSSRIPDFPGSLRGEKLASEAKKSEHESTRIVLEPYSVSFPELRRLF